MSTRSTIKYLSAIPVLFKGLLSFLIFLITSQFFTFFTFIPLPGDKNRQRETRQRVLASYARFLLNTHFNIKLRLEYPPELDFSKPRILLFNHHTLLDVPLSFRWWPKVLVITNDWLDRSPFRFLIKPYTHFHDVSSGLENHTDYMRGEAAKGYSMIVFPEGRRSENHRILRFHNGAFYLATQLDIEILPVVLCGSEGITGPRWFYLKHGRLTARVLPPQKIRQETGELEIHRQASQTCALMRKHFEEIQSSFRKHKT